MSLNNTGRISPIEMAFAKLKAHLRAAAARLPDALTTALGRVCGLLEPTECQPTSKPQAMRLIKGAVL